MANEKGREGSGGSTSYAAALGRIVDGLQKQPPLLVALGGGILVLGVAGVVGGALAGQAWLLIVAIVVLVLAGLGAWLVAIRRGSQGARFRPTIKSGGEMTGTDIGSGGPGVGDFAPKIESKGDMRATGAIGSWDASQEPSQRRTKKRPRKT
jgi:hypothetical protein